MLPVVHSCVEINTRPSPHATGTETVTCRFWKEVQWLEDHPRHATSLLLMTNPYWASNFDAFEQFGDALTQALQSATESKVEGLGFEGQIQLVFFHPQYVSVWKSKCYGAESPRRRRRHRHGACSMAWRCRFLTTRPLRYVFRDGGERAGLCGNRPMRRVHPTILHQVISRR